MGAEPPRREAAGGFALRSRETVVAVVGFAALVLAFFAPVLAAWDRWGIEDWDQHAFYHEAARRSLLEYRQLPLWNPYYCGGTDLLANPQSRVLAPTFPLVLAFGAAAGLKLDLALHALLGLIGLYAVGRRQGLDPPSACVAPSGYFLSTLYALPASTGMSWITSAGYLPWAFYFHLGSYDDRRDAVACGAALALGFFAGGAYLFVITLAFLSLHALLGARDPGWRITLSSLAITLVACAALGAVKLLPSVAFMADFPRRMTHPSGLSVQSLAIGLFAEDQAVSAPARRFDGAHLDSWTRGIASDFDDVGMYVGPVVAALCAIGMVVAGRKRWKLVVTTLAFVVLSFGDRFPIGPYAWLHRLPVFVSMRYAERYRFVWLLCALLIAGHGLRWIRERWDLRFPASSRGAWVSSAVVAALLVDFLLRTRPIYERAFPIPPMAVEPAGEFRQITRLPNYDADGVVTERGGSALETYGSWSAHMPALLANRGAVDCYETAFIPRSARPMTDPAYRGEAFLEGRAGEVATALWTPNRLRYAVRVANSDRLVVNQNFDRGWKATDGRPLASADGLLAIPIVAADREVEIVYRPRSFVLGALISGCAWLLLAGALVRRAITP